MVSHRGLLSVVRNRNVEESRLADLKADIDRLLDDLDDFELNLNQYFDEPGVSSMINGVLSGRVAALAGYLTQLEMADLLEAVMSLDPDPDNAIQVLETIRSYISPELRRRLSEPSFSPPRAYEMSTEDLMEEIEAQRSIMISVATGGPRIQTVNREYIQRRARIAAALSERGIRDPNPYSDLWAWHGKWSSGDLRTYQSRRDFIRKLYDPVVEELRDGPALRVIEEATGWPEVDRRVDRIRRQLRSADSTEEFQAVGLYCREALISLAQEVYRAHDHPSVDGTDPSSSDAKRMLEAFFAAELAGSANKIARKYARAALDLANELQHERTATLKDAALCSEATVSVVNIVAITSERKGR